MKYLNSIQIVSVPDQYVHLPTVDREGEKRRDLPLSSLLFRSKSETTADVMSNLYKVRSV